MAVDSESKRRSAPNMLVFVIPPVPDGTIANVDREQASYLYSGITPASPAGGITHKSVFFGPFCGPFGGPIT